MSVHMWIKRVQNPTQIHQYTLDPPDCPFARSERRVGFNCNELQWMYVSEDNNRHAKNEVI